MLVMVDHVICQHLDSSFVSLTCEAPSLLADCIGSYMTSLGGHRIKETLLLGQCGLMQASADSST